MHTYRSISLLALASSLSFSASAGAHDKNVVRARDVVHCMQARMKSDQHESYREAFKVCKQQTDAVSHVEVAATHAEPNVPGRH